LCAFSTSLTTTVFSHGACGGLQPPTAGRLRRAKPSSPAQHRVKKLYLQTELLGIDPVWWTQVQMAFAV
jgi:hypothetical protein